MLSTTHDFYLGRGPNADWMGSLHLGACACSSLEGLYEATAAGEYRDRVMDLLHEVEANHAGTAFFPDEG